MDDAYTMANIVAFYRSYTCKEALPLLFMGMKRFLIHINIKYLYSKRTMAVKPHQFVIWVHIYYYWCMVLHDVVTVLHIPYSAMIVEYGATC